MEYSSGEFRLLVRISSECSGECLRQFKAQTQTQTQTQTQAQTQAVHSPMMYIQRPNIVAEWLHLRGIAPKSKFCFHTAPGCTVMLELELELELEWEVEVEVEWEERAAGSPSEKCDKEKEKHFIKNISSTKTNKKNKI
jgi:hypothetical protein